MSKKELSFIRLAAIGTWHCFNQDTRSVWETMDAEEARRVESFRQELRKIVGSKADVDITINGGCLETMIDDLRFVAYEMISAETGEHWTLVTLLGRCPSCGVETMSEPVADLTMLGKMLERFVPIYTHYCHTRPRNTIQDRQK